mmetsp:Transcript_14238/g.40476  ORF Transcript_14238/g.40476 Transcript_14238/m.40476 type:complete len:332 (+) Transcript_14238:241-1236(+)
MYLLYVSLYTSGNKDSSMTRGRRFLALSWLPINPMVRMSSSTCVSRSMISCFAIRIGKLCIISTMCFLSVNILSQVGSNKSWYSPVSASGSFTILSMYACTKGGFESSPSGISITSPAAAVEPLRQPWALFPSGPALLDDRRGIDKELPVDTTVGRPEDLGGFGGARAAAAAWAIAVALRLSNAALMFLLVDPLAALAAASLTRLDDPRRALFEDLAETAPSMGSGGGDGGASNGMELCVDWLETRRENAPALVPRLTWMYASTAFAAVKCPKYATRRAFTMRWTRRMARCNTRTLMRNVWIMRDTLLVCILAANFSRNHFTLEWAATASW